MNKHKLIKLIKISSNVFCLLFCKAFGNLKPVHTYIFIQTEKFESQSEGHLKKNCTTKKTIYLLIVSKISLHFIYPQNISSSVFV